MSWPQLRRLTRLCSSLCSRSTLPWLLLSVSLSRSSSESSSTEEPVEDRDAVDTESRRLLSFSKPPVLSPSQPGSSAALGLGGGGSSELVTVSRGITWACGGASQLPLLGSSGTFPLLRCQLPLPILLRLLSSLWPSLSATHRVSKNSRSSPTLSRFLPLPASGDGGGSPETPVWFILVPLGPSVGIIQNARARGGSGTKCYL
ncbi:hypothetical protein FKM82_029490 [Ascaphus truei]